MFDALSSLEVPIPGVEKRHYSTKTQLNSQPKTTSFTDVIDQIHSQTKPNQAKSVTGSRQLDDAAHQMEVQLVTMMLKTMDKSGTEKGLLGNSSQGMDYFKDLFFEKIAEEVVSQKGLGFAGSLENTYKHK